MNERIMVIEQSLAILWEARLEAHAAHNEVGHHIVCNAIHHLNAEFKAMVADTL